MATLRQHIARLVVLAIVLFAVGCGHMAKSTKNETLRKQVESDSFPSAQQAGLAK